MLGIEGGNLDLELGTRQDTCRKFSKIANFQKLALPFRQSEGLFLDSLLLNDPLTAHLTLFCVVRSLCLVSNSVSLVELLVLWQFRSLDRSGDHFDLKGLFFLLFVFFLFF
jgi:pilus assembly protein TadC